MNCDWVHNQPYKLSHDIHVVSLSFITFNNIFKLITKIRFSNNSFKFKSGNPKLDFPLTRLHYDQVNISYRC